MGTADFLAPAPSWNPRLWPQGAGRWKWPAPVVLCDSWGEWFAGSGGWVLEFVWQARTL